MNARAMWNQGFNSKTNFREESYKKINFHYQIDIILELRLNEVDRGNGWHTWPMVNSKTDYLRTIIFQFGISALGKSGFA